MSRITKTIAEQVAQQLVSKHREEIKVLSNERSQFITDLYEKSIPEAVLKAFKTNRGYINSDNDVRIIGAGFENWNSYDLIKELPVNGKHLEVDNMNGDLIKNMDAVIEDKTKAMRELYKSIDVALFNLRTYSNVEKEFPEAFPFLPKESIDTALTVNIKDIRSKLEIAS